MKLDVQETAISTRKPHKNDVQLETPQDAELPTTGINVRQTCDKSTEGAKLNDQHVVEDNDAQNSTDHFEPSVRLLKIPKSENGACGFHLTRSKWDPYPWVSGVDADTPAELCGLKAGDCILEVNGEDVLGLRITDIANLVKVKSEYVTMLLWSTGWDPKCDPENLCCGPMPRSLQRLSVIVQSILSVIECPVCLDTIPPPAMQCQNGHLLCVKCRIRAEKCPVCRDRYTPRRALIAEQIYNAITTAFNICRNEDKLRQKLFGPNAKQPKSGIKIPADATKQQKVPQRGAEVNKSRVGVSLPTNKFLAKLFQGKACSMENLVTATTATTSTSTTTNTGVLISGNSTPSLFAVSPTKAMNLATPPLSTCSNQFHDMTTAKNHLTSLKDDAACNVKSLTPSATNLPSTLGGTLTSSTNNVAQVNAMSKHFSLSTNDLSQQQQRHNSQHQLEPHPYALDSTDVQLIAIERCPSLQRLNGISTSKTYTRSSFRFRGKSTPSPSSSTSSLLFLDKRRPCNSLNGSIECIRKRLQLPDVENSKRTTNSPLSTSSYSSSFSTSSGIFTSSESPTLTRPCAATIEDELLSLSAPPSPEQIATTTFSSFQSSSLTASSSLSSSTSTSSVELSLAPVDTSNSADITLELSTLPPPTSAFVVEHSSPFNLAHKNSGRYLCPCNCGCSFNTSSQLQRHVKVEHHLPILSYGGASAQLALPLRQPVDNAVIILEIENDSNDTCRHRAAKGYDESVKSDNAVQHNVKDIKECWIRIERLGDDVIQTSALLHATADESVDFMMETRLSVKAVNSDKTAGTAVERLDPCEDWRRQEAIRSRSLVHSMETTTWQQTFNQYNCNKNNNNNINYKNVSKSNANDADNLSVISVIQQHGVGYKDGDLLLNIDVRRRN